MRRPRRLFPILLCLAAALAACADDPRPYVERPAEDIYNEGMDQLHTLQFEAAAASFDEVERQHPYSVWATQAQIMVAYAHYRQNNYDEAVIASRRFIQLHPGHPDVAYAYYLIGISYYEQISDIGRDQGRTEEALQAFNELTRRFPNSDYARDARQKIVFVRDHLAGKEMDVGRYYLERKQYLAAVGRFRQVIERYENTTHTPEALHRLVEAYLALGMIEEAERAAAILGYNYPDSEWYRDTHELIREAVPEALNTPAG